ncbi:50S ribosomal protein L24 [bacterium DOLZORAL124_38_8]|nr:MAG: 50S ribosomal protein L24 [bacterium DOLZORAL124_38_8]
MKLRINDTVMVVTGSDKGQSGVITKISKDKQRVTVEGVNRKVKHMKGQMGQAGQRVEFFAPINVSNVSLVDPKSGKPTKVAYKYEAGKKVRIAKASGMAIDGSAPAKVKKTTKK